MVLLGRTASVDVVEPSDDAAAAEEEGEEATHAEVADALVAWGVSVDMAAAETGALGMSCIWCDASSLAWTAPRRNRMLGRRECTWLVTGLAPRGVAALSVASSSSLIPSGGEG